MKTLFVTGDPAFPPISGVDLRIWQNARAAAELGPVMLASIDIPRSAVPPPGVQIRHISGMDIFEVWAADFDAIFSTRTREQLRSTCAEFQPDIIVLESLPLVNLARVAGECTQALIIDLHNVESELVAQEALGNAQLRANGALEQRSQSRSRPNRERAAT